MLDFIVETTKAILVLYASISLLSVIVPNIIHVLLPEQDLKKKYNAKWGIVTGASTGIGRSIVEKLASQEINVVLVALEDDFLKNFFSEIKKKYPKLQFRSVGVDLSKDGYMDAIIKATDDIPVSLVFNNAGYIVGGVFADMALEKSINNMNVNATASVKVTHHFLNKMTDAGLKGCVIFTSSPAGYFPNPCTSMYASTKTFITRFAQSIAGETKAVGIDVLVVHPSPVNTNFYKGENVNKVDTLNSFKKLATTPDTIASVMFSSVGRTVVRDQGWTTFWFKLLSQFIDVNFISWLAQYVVPYTGDYKRLKTDRKKAN